MGSPTLIANVLFICGEVESRDDPPAALAAFEEAAALIRAGADVTNFGGTLAGLARQREIAGDVDGALGALAEAVDYFSRAGKSTVLLRPMAQLSRLLAAFGRHEAAVVMAGVLIDGTLASLTFAGTPERMHRSLVTAREALGPERYAAAVARGTAMTSDDAMAYARAELDGMRAALGAGEQATR